MVYNKGMTGHWKSILRLERNNAGKDFVCGDIHGCFDDLEMELRTIRFNKTKDRLFSVGDLIDRGPKSELAAAYMNSFWFFPLMGNHEYIRTFHCKNAGKKRKVYEH